MIKEFDSVTEKIVFFGKWKYVVHAFFEFENFTYKNFKEIFQNVEFQLEMTMLDSSSEAFIETEAFLKWALVQVDTLIKDFKQIKLHEEGSIELQNLYAKIADAFIHLMYRDQRRSEESIELFCVKKLFDDALFEYGISMDGIILEAPDEMEIVQQWLYDSFLLLSKEEQKAYYTELSHRIKHVNLVTSCETYHLSLLRIVSLVDTFRKSIQMWLEQLDHGTGNVKRKADDFSKSIIHMFNSYHEYLKIAEISCTVKWIFKFLVEKRQKRENVYEF